MGSRRFELIKRTLIFGLAVLCVVSAGCKQDAPNKLTPSTELTESPPKLDGESKGPVLLRYKFEPGKVVNSKSEVYAKAWIDTEGTQTENLQTHVTLYFTSTVDDVTDEGNAMLNRMVTRIVYEVGPFQYPPSLRYDSDTDEAPDERLPEMLSLMLNRNIPFALTPLGNKPDSDLERTREALQLSGDEGALETLEGIKSRILQTMAPLPENPVSVGDVFEADETSYLADAIGVSVSTTYRVLAISGDRKKVLLKPVTSIEWNEEPLYELETDGWILFDLERGYIDSSYIESAAKQTESFGGKTSTVLTHSVATYEVLNYDR